MSQVDGVRDIRSRAQGEPIKDRIKTGPNILLAVWANIIPVFSTHSLVRHPDMNQAGPSASDYAVPKPSRIKL